MKPTDNIREYFDNAPVDTNPRMDATVLGKVLTAHDKANSKDSAVLRPGTRSMIMRNPKTRFAVAAAVVAAAVTGMYVLTGSVDGTSITIAQVRDAMQELDWMHMSNRTGPEVAWYSFASKVQIAVDDEGAILYLDFDTGKHLRWDPSSATIYESPIDEARQFASGISGPSEVVDKFFGSLEDDGWEVTRDLGTYDGRKVEIWTAGQKASTSVVTMRIDAETKLPVCLTQTVKNPDGTVHVQTDVGFDYPATGPADIYEAGAPRSAPIKPAPDQ